MSKAHFTFLGYSEPTIAMLMETIYSNLNNEFEVDIIQNVQLDKKHEFAINNVKYNIIRVENWDKNYHSKYILSVGSSIAKRKVFDFFKSKFPLKEEEFINLIHSSSQISQTVKLRHGVHIQQLVTLAPFVELGNFITINRNASIGHHTTIGNYSIISPSATIAGFCNINQSVTIGAGATIIDGISIGENSFIGAGSLVTKDIPPNVVAYGNPAKVIRDI